MGAAAAAMLRGAMVVLTALCTASIGAGSALARAGGKMVSYRGFSIVVPAAWPVYDLSADPTVCVRFNRHAVYLGRPTGEQRCPAHAAGRTEAILVEPLLAGAARSHDASGPVLAPVHVPAAQGGRGSSARIGIPGHGLVATVTWGSHPGVVARALGVRTLGSGRPGPGAGRSAPGAVHRDARARTAGAAVAGGLFTGLGFDACSAPGPSAMSAWGAAPYRAIGIYIGGTNAACSEPNLTATWTGVQSQAGWHLIPIYVGLQAPGNSCGCASIATRSGRAAAQGTAAAVDAVTQAQALGMGAANPIFFDMEAYNRSRTATSAVRAFLAAWTTQLHADGYSSGVYSSANSGITDLANAFGTSFTEPDEIWIANWNGQQATSDPAVPAGDWMNHQRLHQYLGGHNATYGGVTINIDSNYLDAPTAAAANPFPDGTFVQPSGSPSVFRVAGGAPLLVNEPSALGATPSAYVTISQQQFDSLSPVPADGTFLTTSTGASYRVAGGAPLFVSDWSRFGGIQPSVMIEEWDIDNIADPAAHLHAVPADGTFLTSTSGRSYRVAGGRPFPISSWSVYGGARPSVTVDQWNINNRSNPMAHLSVLPANGTVVEGLPSQTYWVFVSGARKPAGATPLATTVDDIGLSRFRILVPPTPRCVVPSLMRLTLGQAQRALLRARCRLGKVRRPRHPPRHRALRVTTQSPSPRTRGGVRSAVNVTLG